MWNINEDIKKDSKEMAWQYGWILQATNRKQYYNLYVMKQNFDKMTKETTQYIGLLRYEVPDGYHFEWYHEKYGNVVYEDEDTINRYRIVKDEEDD